MSRRARSLVSRLAAATATFAMLLAAPAVSAPGTSATATTTASTTTATTVTKTATTTRTTTTTATKTTSSPTTSTTTTTTSTTTTKKKKAAPPQPLDGMLGGGAAFPARTLVLSSASLKALSASQLTVTENGNAVSRLAVTPLTTPGTRDFGVVLVIDQSPSMTGAPISQAMTAARAFAAERLPNQQLGVITFDGSPSVILPMTSNPGAIAGALSTTPWIGSGTHILEALDAAVAQLKAAKVAAGGIVLISDGGNAESGTKLSPASVGAAAQAIGAPIYTVGINDRYFDGTTLRTLATVGGGKFVTAKPAQLPKVLTGIADQLMKRFLVRYRSPEAAGQSVSLSARVSGIPGTVDLGYVAPKPLVLPKPKPAPTAAQSTPTLPPATQTLSPTPSFAQPAASTAPAHRSQSFLQSSTGILVIALTCGLLLAAAVALVLMHRPAKNAVQERVSSFIPGAAEDEHEDASAAATPRADGNGFEQMLSRRRWWPEFVQNTDVGHLSRTPVEIVKLSALVALVLAVVLTLMLGSVLPALAVLVIWPTAMRTLVRHAATKQRIKFVDQLPSHLQDLAGAMRAGRSLAGAFAAVGDAASEPTRSEFERVVADEQLGRPLEQSLEAIAARMGAEDMEQVALIASLHRRSGSNVAEALDRVAEGARERADLGRELRALTGQARISSVILTAMPPLLLLAISIIAPSYERPMFHTPGGIFLLCLTAVMVFLGWHVMRRITHVEP